MSIKSFYKGYLFTLILVIILCVLKMSFIEVMATIGISITSTVIIFFTGWLLYRIYLYICDRNHSGD